jgi:hypothetical protein
MRRFSCLLLVRRIVTRLQRLLAICGCALLLAPSEGHALCEDPRLSLAPEWRAECRTHELPYSADNERGIAQLAQVRWALQSRGDYFTPIYRFFLRTPSDDIVPLNEFLVWTHNIPAIRIAYALGLVDGRATLASDDRHFELYDIVLERVANQYCLTYRMKPPLQGYLRDCDPNVEPEGAVGYMAGTVHAREAWKIACKRHLDLTGEACEPYGFGEMFTLMYRDPENALWYLVVLRRHLTPNFPSEWEYAFYRVDAESRRTEFVERTKVQPSAEEVRRTYGRRGGLCNNALVRCGS